MIQGDEIRVTLKQIGVRPNKELGQNFLSSGGVPQLISNFARVQSGEWVVEIGPGLGALSGELLPLGLRDVIEYDERLAEYFMQTYPQVHMHQADARSFDFSALRHQAGDQTRLTIFGNLPYSFTSEIIFALLAHSASISRTILMVQKEVAERIGAAPGSKKYGALSVGVQLHCDVRTGPVIGPENFHPRPAVDSQVLELRFLERPRFNVGDPFFFRRLVQGVFSHRRKRLDNALVASTLFKSVDLNEILSSVALDPGKRPEAVSLEEFALLSRTLVERGV